MASKWEIKWFYFDDLGLRVKIAYAVLKCPLRLTIMEQTASLRRAH